MQPKSLLVSALSVASIVSAQSSGDVASSSIVSIIDGYVSALTNVSPQKLDSLTAYLASAQTNSAFVAAASAVSATDGAIISQEQSFLANAATATNAPLPAYITGLPSSAQGAASSYYAGAASIIAPAGSPSSASSSGGSGTTATSSQPSSSSSSSTSSSASAKASNDAVAQHPGTFMAVAAGALGMAALL